MSAPQHVSGFEREAWVQSRNNPCVMCFEKIENQKLFFESLGLSLSIIRHCATSHKVAGLIPDGAIAIFYWLNSSGRTLTLGSNQSLKEMSTRTISWEKRRPVR